MHALKNVKDNNGMSSIFSDSRTLLKFPIKMLTDSCYFIIEPNKKKYIKNILYFRNLLRNQKKRICHVANHEKR
jgi:hypothetical protein